MEGLGTEVSGLQFLSPLLEMVLEVNTPLMKPRV